MDVDKLAGVERVTGLGLLEKHQCPWVTGGGGGGCCLPLSKLVTLELTRPPREPRRGVY